MTTRRMAAAVLAALALAAWAAAPRPGGVLAGGGQTGYFGSDHSGGHAV